MDKAELKNICSRWLWKAFETGTKQDPFSAENSEYWHPAIDLKWSKDMADAIDEYVQQRERNAYPNTEAGGVVFCGKCGTAI